MNFVKLICYIISFYSLVSCVQTQDQTKLVKDIDKGLELYKQVRETPESVRVKQNYSDAVVYGGARNSFWIWKHQFVSIYSREAWSQFVQEAISKYGSPHKQYSPKDLLKYQPEPVLR